MNNPFRPTTALGSVVLAMLVFFVAPLGATAAPAVGTAHTAARIVTYNADRAAEFQDVVDRAARIWNSSVDNVELRRVSGPADVTVLADNGWPRARTIRLGAGTIWMGREAVEMGHDPTRIAAHEFGHIFGLPDRRTGLCEDLMSGHSAGTGCDNAQPNEREIAEVERNFAWGARISPRLYVDSSRGSPESARR